jgi:hypothetical protein
MHAVFRPVSIDQRTLSANSGENMAANEHAAGVAIEQAALAGAGVG